LRQRCLALQRSTTRVSLDTRFAFTPALSHPAGGVLKRCFQVLGGRDEATVAHPQKNVESPLPVCNRPSRASEPPQMNRQPARAGHGPQIPSPPHRHALQQQPYRRRAGNDSRSPEMEERFQVWWGPTHKLNLPPGEEAFPPRLNPRQRRLGSSRSVSTAGRRHRPAYAEAMARTTPPLSGIEAGGLSLRYPPTFAKQGYAS
jgi:hypothetical protein